MRVVDGEGITRFTKIACEQLSQGNVTRIILISPWIGSRKGSLYPNQRLISAIGEAKRRNKITCYLEIYSRPPDLDDFASGGKFHADALLEFLDIGMSAIYFVNNLHTKLYHMSFKDNFMGGSYTMFGSANWTWQAESKKNVEALLEIQGSESLLTEMMLRSGHTGLKSLSTCYLNKKIIKKKRIFSSTDLAELLKRNS